MPFSITEINDFSNGCIVINRGSGTEMFETWFKGIIEP
jgi:hypothetical protein